MYFTSVHLRFIKPKESYPVKLKQVNDEWLEAWRDARIYWDNNFISHVPIGLELKWWQKLLSVRITSDGISWRTHT